MRRGAADGGWVRTHRPRPCSAPEVTARASCGLCGQDGSSARVPGVVGVSGQPCRLPSRLSRRDESRTQAVEPLPHSQRGRVTPWPWPAPHRVLRPLPGRSHKANAACALNPRPLRPGRKPNTETMGVEGTLRRCGERATLCQPPPGLPLSGAWWHSHATDP